MLPWSGGPVLLEPVPQAPASKVGCSWLSSCLSGWPTFTKPPHGSRLRLCHCLPLQHPDKFLRRWPDIKLSEDGCFCCWPPVQPPNNLSLLSRSPVQHFHSQSLVWYPESSTCPLPSPRRLPELFLSALNRKGSDYKQTVTIIEAKAKNTFCYLSPGMHIFQEQRKK